MVDTNTEPFVLRTNPVGWRIFINLIGKNWSFGTLPNRSIDTDTDQ